MQLTQALHSAVQQRPDAIATVDAGRTRTWREIGDRVARLAGALRGLGVAPGDRVAVLAMNCDRYIECFYGIAWAGAVIVPMNTRWALAENVYALQDCGAKVLLVDATFAEAAGELSRKTGCDRLVILGDDAAPGGMLTYEDLLRAAAPTEDLCGGYDDLMGIFYTGGTTGFPKGVMLSHRNVVYEALVWIYSVHFNERTRYLHVAGMFHLAGASPVFALTLVGGTHISLPKFEPEPVMRVIAEQRVNYCLFVPTMINMLLNHPSFGRYDLSSVEDCEYGASPILARLHAVDWEGMPIASLAATSSPREAAAAQVALWWDRIAGAQLRPHALLTAADLWFRANLPTPSHAAIVHGDYRVGNFLEERGRISAVLDWELAHLGDPVEDLGWALLPMYNGGRKALLGVLSQAEVLERYEALTGLAVRPAHLAFYTAFALYKSAGIQILAARRFEDGGFGDARLAGMGSQLPGLLRQIDRALERAAG